MIKLLKIIGIPAALLLVGATLCFALDIRVAYFTGSAFQPTLIKGEDFPKTLVDATGEEYVLSKPPERIVSVTLGADEILSDLIDERRIVGVTYLAEDVDVSNIPNKFAGQIQRVRGEVEEILALEPDLVFVASYTRAETVRLLFGAGIPVVRLSGYSSYAELEQNIILISQATGSELRANAILEELRAYVEDIQDRMQGLLTPRVLFYNLNGYTSGTETIVDEMIQLAGGYNVVREVGISGTHKISQEMAMGLEPDVILMTGWSELSDTQPSELLMKNPSWQHVPAIQNNRVYDLRGYWVLSVSQYSWNGIGQIAQRLHPEAFTP